VLASFQALKHRAANLAVEVEVSARLNDQALEAAARRDPDASLWIHLAKATASDTYAWVTQDCLQLHGGVGVTWEFDCHLFLKRARLNQALGGDNPSHLDAAELALAHSVREGRSIMELPR
jgi:alkylation response protein AidB-like acyl-CoA dehydrogenase